MYILYIVFQLKSHSYLYASIPQQIIDEESHPGVLAELMNSSSDSSSSSSDESDDTTTSWTTAKRIKKAVKGRKLRKFSTNSSNHSAQKKVVDMANNNPSPKSHSVSGSAGSHQGESGSCAIDFCDDVRYEADDDGARSAVPRSRDFAESDKKDRKAKKAEKAAKRQQRKSEAEAAVAPEKRDILVASAAVSQRPSLKSHASEPSVTRKDLDNRASADVPKRRSPFRPMSLLSNTVFSSTQAPATPNAQSTPSGSVPVIRRTNSLPGRISRPPLVGNAVQYARGAARMPNAEDPAAVQAPSTTDPQPGMSRTAAVVMLILSTALVAVCAEFLVDAIPEMIESSNVSEAFIGLIILPIVSNAAEHVTAVSVATKNKMDLSIGVSVGSSIQIAIFVTPLVVILGWCMGKDMSLYFTLFETISLFVTAFVVNFLVLDGRSNYLEGSLLIAAYVIIAYVFLFLCLLLSTLLTCLTVWDLFFIPVKTRQVLLPARVNCQKKMDGIFFFFFIGGLTRLRILFHMIKLHESAITVYGLVY